MYKTVIALAAVVSVGLLSACDQAQTSGEPEAAFQVNQVVEEMHRPWSIAFLEADEWLVTERRGQLYHVRDDGAERDRVGGLPEIVALMQGGLLDVVLHPDFDDNGWVYLVYVQRCEDCGTTPVIGRGRWNDGQLADFEEVYVVDACGQDYRHYGGRLVFEDDGYMYLTVGERNERNRAQDTGDEAGAILRLTDEGRIPDDNPLVDDEQARDAIWSWGHRNPQGLTLHPETGELWQNEHGPSGGDELNLIRPGLNYGWPKATHGREYYGPKIGPAEKEGMEPPLEHWTPSIAPSGMAFYDGEVFEDWQGDLFMGSLSRTSLIHLKLDGYEVVAEDRLLDDLEHRIRDVRVGPDGLIYLLIDHEMGGVLRLEPADG